MTPCKYRAARGPRPTGVLSLSLIASCALTLGGYAQSLQERIDAAAAGATLEIPAGVYEGAIVVSKPLSLRATGQASIRGTGRTHVVHIKAKGVVLEGFEISGSGTELGKDHAAVFVDAGADHAIIRNNTITDSLHGIYIKKANDCQLIGNRITGKAEVAVPANSLQGLDAVRARPSGGESCEIGLDQNRRGNGIHLWNSERATITNNTIRNGRDGVYFSFANRCVIRGNDIAQVRFGLHYMYSDGNVFENNRFGESAAGSTLMFSRNMLIRGNTFAANAGHRAYGMVLTQVDNSRIERNEFTGNTIGLCVEYSNQNTFAGNTFARSYIAARLTGGSDANRFARNVFTSNLHPVEIDGDVSNNQWSDKQSGNRWGHSAEVDFNGDGIGELPHRESDLLGPLRRPFPLVALLSDSPVLKLVRFAQQHVKIPGVQAIHDPKPLTATFSSTRR